MSVLEFHFARRRRGGRNLEIASDVEAFTWPICNEGLANADHLTINDWLSCRELR